jgi:hypothetical protein
MSRLDAWLFRRIIRNEVTQGPSHAENLKRVYQVIREECRREFCEDSVASLDAFLLERFNEASS